MPISKPRNRVVLFRLTQEEYAQVQHACAESEARSVSDFARERILTPPAAPQSSSSMEARIDDLSRAVEHLTRLVEANAPPRAEAATAFAHAAQ